MKIDARIQSKNDTQANWNRKIHFVPLRGEIIIYNPDATHPYARVKVGDGDAYLIDLPFITDNATSGGNSAALTNHINNTQIHITGDQRTYWNDKVSCEVEDEELLSFYID